MFVISDSGSTGKATFFCQYPYFFLFMIRNISDSRKAKNSATTFAIHIPSTPKIRGSIRMLETWNISVLINDTAAEIAPFQSAVKNDDVNILKPASKKHSENILKA